MSGASAGTTAAQMRSWRGIALLSFGFRPFFLGAGVWATLAMVLWIGMLSGALVLPTAFDPVSWHAHEFLFGYLGAVLAGFLLTAVPNWTGRLPIVGWPLGGLFALWLLGRLAILVSAHLPPLLVAIADLSMLVVLAVVIAREIIEGRNWRNLVVLIGLSVLIIANAVFLWEAASGRQAANGFGLRLGLGAAVMMIALIGGRIVPSFTRNWLVKRGPGALPTSPMQGFDRLTLFALLAAILLWVAAPDAAPSGAALLLAGLLHLVRLARWAGHRTGAEPLVLVLHVGYLLVPLGAITLGAEILWPGTLGFAAAQHLWMAGAIGLMTLAVMTRATLGHSGRALTAGAGTVAIYAALLLSLAARLAVGAFPEHSEMLLAASGLAWIAAFGGFATLYGALLLQRRARD